VLEKSRVSNSTLCCLLLSLPAVFPAPENHLQNSKIRSDRGILTREAKERPWIRIVLSSQASPLPCFNGGDQSFCLSPCAPASTKCHQNSKLRRDRGILTIEAKGRSSLPILPSSHAASFRCFGGLLLSSSVKTHPELQKSQRPREFDHGNNGHLLLQFVPFCQSTSSCRSTGSCCRSSVSHLPAFTKRVQNSKNRRDRGGLIGKANGGPSPPIDRLRKTVGCLWAAARSSLFLDCPTSTTHLQNLKTFSDGVFLIKKVNGESSLRIDPLEKELSSRGGGGRRERSR
jgi:hypothetical protein